MPPMSRRRTRSKWCSMRTATRSISRAAAIPFVRDAATNDAHLRHQGIYGYTRDLLLQFVKWKPSPLERAESLEQLRALENGIRIHVLVTKTGSPGIDTPEDAAALEQILARAGRKERRR